MVLLRLALSLEKFFSGHRIFSFTFGSLALVSVSPISLSLAADAVRCDPPSQAEQLKKFADNCQTALKTWNAQTGRWESGCHVGAPINPTTGEVYWIHQPDFTVRNEGSIFSFWRSYRSLNQRRGLLGTGWSSNIEVSVSATSKTKLLLMDETGKEIEFLADGKDKTLFKARSFPGAKVFALAGKGWELLTPENETHRFDSSGRLSSVQFKSGQKMHFIYEQGKLAEIQDEWGKKIRLHYQEHNGLLQSLQEPRTGTELTSFQYDKTDRLIRAEDASGEFETYEYSGTGTLLARAMDGAGALIEAHRYDDNGLGIYSKSMEGEFEITRMPSPEGTHLVKVKNLETHTEAVMGYDEAGRQISRQGDAGLLSSEANRYDDEGRLVGQTNGKLKSTLKYEEDRPVEMVDDAEGSHRKIQLAYHHPHGFLTKISEPSVVNPKSQKERIYEYTGDLLKRETERGWTWDLEGRVKEYHAITNYAYNPSGQMVSKSDANGILKYSYFPKNAPGFNAGRVQKIFTPDGETVAYEDYDFYGTPRAITYNANLRQTLMTLANGKVAVDPVGKHYRYDKGGKLLLVEEESGAYKRYAYDGEGKLSKVYIKSSRWSSEQVTHDADHEPELSPADWLEKNLPHSVDARGNLASVGKTEFKYDLNNRLIETHWPNGTNAILQYDDYGRLSAEGPSADRLTRYEYDSAGRRTGKRLPSGQVIHFSYDSAGRLQAEGDTRISYPAKFARPLKLQNAATQTSFDYDGLGNQIGQSTLDLPSQRQFMLKTGADFVQYPDGYQIYSRNDEMIGSDGRTFLSIESPQRYAVGPIAVEKTQEQSKERTYKAGELFDLHYTWDQRGLLTQIEDHRSGERSQFKYTSEGFLAEEERSSSSNKQNWKLRYDSLGNLESTKAESAQDRDGRVVSDGGNHYTYDSQGRLIRAQTPKGPAEYRYDSMGRRVAKTFAGVTTFFSYDESGRLLFEATPARSEKVRYVYRGSEVIAFQVIRHGHVSDHFVLNDHRLAPLVVVNALGQVEARVSQETPYMLRMKAVAGAEVRYPFGFLGQYYDEETGLYYNEARYYDPAQARYLTPDPIGIFGGANLYAYASGNPLRFVDPHGTVASDSSIMTAEDAAACHMPAPTNAAVIDPHTLPDDGSVYRVGSNRWSLGKEKDFAKWVHDNVDADFMERYQLKTDCAKAATTIRAIFSRIDNLPALFTNGQKNVGNASKDWSKLRTIPDWSGDNWKTALNDDARFRAYVYAAMSVVSTSSIPMNTYPVRLSDEHDPNKLSQYVHEGTPLVDATHVRFITQINSGTFMPVQELASDLPVEVRQLNGGPFSLFNYPKDAGRGVVDWRWAVNCGGKWKMIPGPEMPGYSQQQYELPTEPSLAAAQAKLKQLQSDEAAQKAASAALESQKNHFTPDEKWNYDTAVAKYKEDKYQEALTTRTIALYQKTPDLKYTGTLPSYVHHLAGDRPPTDQDIKKGVDLLVQKVQDRVKLVSDAQKMLKDNQSVFKDPSSSTYDDYSTPERDKQAFLLWKSFVNTMAAFDTSKSNLSDRLKAEMQSRTIDLGDGHKINLELFFEAIPAGKVSSDPGASFAQRWGLDYIKQQVGTKLAESQTSLQQTQQAKNAAVKQLAAAAPKSAQAASLKSTVNSDNEDISFAQNLIAFFKAEKARLSP